MVTTTTSWGGAPIARQITVQAKKGTTIPSRIIETTSRYGGGTGTNISYPVSQAPPPEPKIIFNPQTNKFETVYPKGILSEAIQRGVEIQKQQTEAAKYFETAGTEKYLVEAGNEGQAPKLLQESQKEKKLQQMINAEIAAVVNKGAEVNKDIEKYQNDVKSFNDNLAKYPKDEQGRSLIPQSQYGKIASASDALAKRGEEIKKSAEFVNTISSDVKAQAQKLGIYQDARVNKIESQNEKIRQVMAEQIVTVTPVSEMYSRQAGEAINRRNVPEAVILTGKAYVAEVGASFKAGVETSNLLTRTKATDVMGNTLAGQALTAIQYGGQAATIGFAAISAPVAPTAERVGKFTGAQYEKVAPEGLKGIAKGFGEFVGSTTVQLGAFYGAGKAIGKATAPKGIEIKSRTISTEVPMGTKAPKVGTKYGKPDLKVAEKFGKVELTHEQLLLSGKVKTTVGTKQVNLPAVTKAGALETKFTEEISGAGKAGKKVKLFEGEVEGAQKTQYIQATEIEIKQKGLLRSLLPSQKISSAGEVTQFTFREKATETFGMLKRRLLPGVADTTKQIGAPRIVKGGLKSGLPSIGEENFRFVKAGKASPYGSAEKAFVIQEETAYTTKPTRFFKLKEGIEKIYSETAVSDLAAKIKIRIAEVSGKGKLTYSVSGSEVVSEKTPGISLFDYIKKPVANLRQKLLPTKGIEQRISMQNEIEKKLRGISLRAEKGTITSVEPEATLPTIKFKTQIAEAEGKVLTKTTFEGTGKVQGIKVSVKGTAIDLSGGKALRAMEKPIKFTNEPITSSTTTKPFKPKSPSGLKTTYEKAKEVSFKGKDIKGIEAPESMRGFKPTTPKEILQFKSAIKAYESRAFTPLQSKAVTSQIGKALRTMQFQKTISKTLTGATAKTGLASVSKSGTVTLTREKTKAMTAAKAKTEQLQAREGISTKSISDAIRPSSAIIKSISSGTNIYALYKPSSSAIAEATARANASAQGLRVGSLSSLKQKSAEITAIASATATMPAVTTKPMTGSMVDTALKVGLMSASALKFKPATATRTLTATATEVPTVPRTPIVPPPSFFIFGFPEIKGRKAEVNGNQAYNALVYSRQKWNKVNREPLSKIAAHNEGAYYTDNSTAARYKVVKVAGNPKRVDLDLTHSAATKFRGNKAGNFIERNTYRIDTPNEVRGIPLEGLLAQQRIRKLKGGLAF